MLPERIQNKIKPNPVSGCWEWIGQKNWGGYGRIHYLGKVCIAHRIVYEAFVGQIPKDLQIDHLCRNRACVNPKHLEAVTSRENTLRGTNMVSVNAAKTHCKRGHEYTKENTTIRVATKGKKYRNESLTNRVCKKCSCIRQAKYAARKSAVRRRSPSG